MRTIRLSLLLGIGGAIHAGVAAEEHMFDVPALGTDVDQIAWSKLPELPSETRIIVRGVMGDSGHMHVPAITYFDGRFFAEWNDGFTHENRSGQRVRYATSRDGLAWSEPVKLTGRHPVRAYTACGFWIREGEMFALAALRDAREPVTDEEPLLLAYRWNSKRENFDEPVVMARDFFAQNIPQQTPDGKWLMLGKGGVGSWSGLKLAKGGEHAIDEWTIRDIPGTDKFEEAEWYTLPNGHLVSHFRTRGPARLARSHSTDNGETWSKPVITDFPEASARHHGIRLHSGLYVLIVNPNPSSLRVPLSLALSRDGLVYDRIVNLRSEGEHPRMGNTNRPPGYNYMRGLELGGYLYVIYSLNQEDIALSRISVSELYALYR